MRRTILFTLKSSVLYWTVCFKPEARLSEVAGLVRPLLSVPFAAAEERRSSGRQLLLNVQPRRVRLAGANRPDQVERDDPQDDEP